MRRDCKKRICTLISYLIDQNLLDGGIHSHKDLISGFWLPGTSTGISRIRMTSCLRSSDEVIVFGLRRGGDDSSIHI